MCSQTYVFTREEAEFIQIFQHKIFFFITNTPQKLTVKMNIFIYNELEPKIDTSSKFR